MNKHLLNSSKVLIFAFSFGYKVKYNFQIMKIREKIESEALDMYNDLRRTSELSPMECYMEVAKKLDVKPWNVQYIVIKSRRQGKEVL